MRILTILGAVFVFFMTGCEKDETLNGNKDVQWIYVKGGTFTMGSPRSKHGQGDEVEHSVTLSDYYISKFEITNAQFAEFLNAYKSDKVKEGIYAGQTICNEHMWGVEETDSIWAPVPGFDNYPALNISWYGAKEYCLFNGWRLATEAEWEYAARGGCHSKGYLYSGSDSADLVAWYEPIKEGRPGTHTHPVGQKSPNELGIYDMSGNVWEWVFDFYGDYPREAVTNPTGPETGYYHVFRGGGWLSVWYNCRSSVRSGQGYDIHGFMHNGIRCVKTR
jgi:formylglycine-generating enzyme required for sulfatase activity